MWYSVWPCANLDENFKFLPRMLERHFYFEFLLPPRKYVRDFDENVLTYVYMFGIIQLSETYRF